jgi:alpha-D-xyloside xylohydrolase
MRSLAFDFREDSGIKSIPDQYMFGPAFLVNPVTARMYSLPNSRELRKTRKVYLPKSANWFDFWTGKLIQGGQTIDAAAPIETIPLYVKAGSIIPMGPFLQYATEKAADPIELRVYTGANAGFVLYEDENDTYQYELGKYSTIALTWDESERILTIGARRGDFPGMLKDRTFKIVWVNGRSGTGIEPARQAEIIEYTGKEIKIKKQN